MSIALAIMAKAPVRGQVKTRLAAELGDDRALQIYRRLLAHTRDLASQVEHHLGWKIAWHVTGQGAAAWARSFAPVGHAVIEQTDGDLGSRMQTAFAAELSHQPGGVVMIGCDCPALTLDYLHAAAKKLDEAELVLGPATDGGYVLIALRKMHAELFHGPSWGDDQVLAATLAIAKKFGIGYDLRPQLQDVDTASDVAAFAAIAQ